jgi:hypothetical protein
MPSHRLDETLLMKYLLGGLAEEEQVRIEDRAFADPAFMDALQAAEADLIDAYVQGELTAFDRRAFEYRFLVSPVRRSKVEFARALAQVGGETKAFEFATDEPVWKRLFAFGAGWSPAVQAAAASAVLIVAAAATWLTFENATLRSRIAGLEARQHQLEEQSRAQGPTASRTPVASLIFAAGLSRAETRRNVLELGSSTEIARIEIQLEARDDYPRYRAELRTSSGEDVMTQNNLSSSGPAGQASVVFNTSADLLRSGSYELALKGVAPGNRVEDIGYYYFRVVRTD